MPAGDIIAFDGDPPVPGDEEKCAVLCLGVSGLTFYFITTMGYVVGLAARELTYNGIAGLFTGSIGQLTEKFPRFNRKGEPIPGMFNDKLAAAWLMRRCDSAGHYNPETPIRGPGVWHDDEHGLVVHHGDVITTHLDGDRHGPLNTRPKLQTAGCYLGRAIYGAGPPLSRPAAESGNAADMRALLEMVKLWTFKDPATARLAFGFVAHAAYGAAPRWRIHFLLTGETGLGKTALINFMAALLGVPVSAKIPSGAQAHILNDFSEAGLRQMLSGESRTVFLDEAEERQQDSERIGAVILLLRRMAGGAGAVSVRGSSEGKSRSFTVAGTALICAINPPPMLPQDHSRIAEGELLKGRSDSAHLARVQHAIEAAEDISARFRARQLRQWPVFEQNRITYHAALREGGCDPRMADKFAGLLAAADAALHDHPVEHEAALGEVDRIKNIIADLRADAAEESDALQCWNTLLGSMVDGWQRGERCTIGRLIACGKNPHSGTEARRTLLQHGLRLEVVGYGAYIAVANKHPQLQKIFAATRWRDGGWKRALLRLEIDGRRPVERSKTGIRFDGIFQRAVLIPDDFLPDVYDAKTAAEAPPDPDRNPPPDQG